MPKQGTAKPHVEELQRRLEGAGQEFAMHKQLLYSAHNLTNGGKCDNASRVEVMRRRGPFKRENFENERGIS